jgi:hypothetical protein
MQTLELFTKIIKVESIYKSYQIAKLQVLRSETKWSNKNERGSATALSGEWKIKVENVL